VQQDRARVTVTGAQLKRNEGSVGVSITALPVAGDNEDLILVSFVDDPPPELGRVKPGEADVDASDEAHLQRLARTLAREWIDGRVKRHGPAVNSGGRPTWDRLRLQGSRDLLVGGRVEAANHP
jgi:hypothetical protein